MSTHRTVVLAGMLALGPLLLGAAPLSPRFSVGRSATEWLLVSDVHFNPFACGEVVEALIAHPATDWHALLDRACVERRLDRAPGKPSTYGEDTNYPLLALTLQEMANHARSEAVVLIDGDLLAHDFRGKFEHAAPSGADFEAFAEKTVSFLALEFGAAFSRSQFILTLGNNDSACGDYCVEPGSAFLTRLAAAWEPLVNRDGSAPDFARDFAAGQLYTARLPGSGNAQVVVLNSVLWSKRYQGDPHPGAQELQRLSALLGGPAPSWRWFVLHLPPGPDAFSSAKHLRADSFLDASSEKGLVEQLIRKSGAGAALIAGHSHHASSNLLALPSSATPAATSAPLPILSLPSISPIFKNNPGFVIAEVDLSNGVITHVTRFALQLDHPAPTWSEEQACFAGPFTAASLSAHQMTLMHDPKVAAEDMGCWSGQSAAGAAPADDWPWFLCAEVAEDPSSYCNCVEAQHSKAGGCH